MDMVWVAVASLLHPETTALRTVTRSEIESQVLKLFGATLTTVMIERHLVSSEDRMADKEQPQRGGSRNRYLFRTSNGTTPTRDGRFRLNKAADAMYNGWEKTGANHPDLEAVSPEYKPLLEWYGREYVNA